MPYWYWNVGQVGFILGLIGTGLSLFALTFVALVTSGEYARSTGERQAMRWLARGATLSPLTGGIAYVAWPLLVFPLGFFVLGVARILYRLAWTEAPADKEARLRRERDERDAEIRRMEREAGIR